MIILSILHNITISPEQVQILDQKETIEVIGASLPVWFNKGMTSEPAEEVFCKYKISNLSESFPIKIENDGYLINLPQNKQDYLPLSVELWKLLTRQERQKWYDQNKIAGNISNLYSPEQSGNEFLHFQEFNKIKKRGYLISIMHIVEIKSNPVMTIPSSN